MLMDFGKLVFFMFWGAATRRAKKQTKTDVWRKVGAPWIAVDANHDPGWTLSSGSGHFSCFYILLFSDVTRRAKKQTKTNVWRRVGAPWIAVDANHNPGWTPKLRFWPF